MRIILLSAIILLLLVGTVNAIETLNVTPRNNTLYDIGNTTHKYRNITSLWLNANVNTSKVCIANVCVSSWANLPVTETLWEGNYSLVMFLNNATLNQWLYNQTTQSLNAANLIYQNMSNSTLQIALGTNYTTQVFNAANQIYYNMTNNTFNYMINQSLLTTTGTTFGGEVTGVYNNLVVSNTALNDIYIQLGNTTVNQWLYNQTTPAINYADSLLITTFYNASDILGVRGTVVGTIGNITSYDSNSVNVTEEAGATGLDFRVNFTSITAFNQLVVRYKSSASESHTMIIVIYDYVLNSWESYATVGASVDWNVFTLGVFDSSDHVAGDGNVSVRFYTTANGNTGHVHYFDWVTISKGPATPNSVETDPYSIHLDNTSWVYDLTNALYINMTNTSWVYPLTNALYYNMTNNTFNYMQNQTLQIRTNTSVLTNLTVYAGWLNISNINISNNGNFCLGNVCKTSWPTIYNSTYEYQYNTTLQTISNTTQWNLNIAWDGLLGYNNLTKCSNTQILKMSGSSWACAADESGGAGGTNYWKIEGDWLTPNDTAGAKTVVNVTGLNATTWLNGTTIYESGVSLISKYIQLGNTSVNPWLYNMTTQALNAANQLYINMTNTSWAVLSGNSTLQLTTNNTWAVLASNSTLLLTTNSTINNWFANNASTATDSDFTWTEHNSYPNACAAGQYASTIGDILTCSAPVIYNASYEYQYNTTLNANHTLLAINYANSKFINMTNTSWAVLASNSTLQLTTNNTWAVLSGNSTLQLTTNNTWVTAITNPYYYNMSNNTFNYMINQTLQATTNNTWAVLSGNSTLQLTTNSSWAVLSGNSTLQLTTNSSWAVLAGNSTLQLTTNSSWAINSNNQSIVTNLKPITGWINSSTMNASKVYSEVHCFLGDCTSNITWNGSHSIWY